MVQGQFSEYTIVASGYKVSSVDGSIVTQFDGAKAPFYFRIGATSNSGMTSGGSFGTINTPNPSLNVWHQFALTYCREGGIGLSYYLDGVFQSSNSTVGGAPDVNAASNFRIGTINTIGGQYWDGYLENIRIYNRCLNAAEIKALYVEPWAGVYAANAFLVGGGSVAYTLTAAFGSFTETGITAGLSGGKILTAAFGAFVETGQSASLRWGAKLVAAFGSFTETGQSATLRIAAKLGAAYGAFVETGKAVQFTLSTAANFALTGVYTVTGQAAEFIVSKFWTKQDCTESPWSKADEDCNCD